MSATGVTWHARVLEQDAFDDESMLELYVKGEPMVPDYGYNAEGVAYGFRVDDVAEASVALEPAGAELLGEINRALDSIGADRHFASLPRRPTPTGCSKTRP